MEIVTVFVIFHCLTQGSGFVYQPYLVPPKCPPCDAKSCPQLTFCAGKMVKDHCGCCPRCSSDLFQPHVDVVVTTNNETQTVAPAATDNSVSVSEDACQRRECPRFQVCMVNVQGLPICTCPSLFVCKRGGRNRDKDTKNTQICAKDGVTYESRCHLRIANCNSKKRIKVLHMDACTEADRKEMEKVNDKEKMVSVNTNEVLKIERDNDEGAPSTTKKMRKKKKRKDRKGRKNKKNRKKKKRTRNKRKERRERKERKGRKRQKRTKRRNEGLQHYAYPKSYGELIGRHTKWSSSQVRKSKI